MLVWLIYQNTTEASFTNGMEHILVNTTETSFINLMVAQYQNTTEEFDERVEELSKILLGDSEVDGRNYGYECDYNI